MSNIKTAKSAVASILSERKIKSNYKNRKTKARNLYRFRASQ